MRHIIASLFVSLLAAFSFASAGERAVVVELYTSQGCSSCPPADELLTELATWDHVIPLALHVDYWDYLGWRDKFGHEAFTKRQRNYAQAVNKRTIYTPQMVVDGASHVVGSHKGEVKSLIARHGSKDESVVLDVSKNGSKLTVSAKPVGAGVGPVFVQLVRYVPSQKVAIKRGENAGRIITYSNIVVSWRVLGKWNGTGTYRATASVSGNEPVVVIVQNAGPGQILAAQRLR